MCVCALCCHSAFCHVLHLIIFDSREGSMFAEGTPQTHNVRVFVYILYVYVYVCVWVKNTHIN